MKKNINRLFLALGAIAFGVACSDFEEINKDPNAVSPSDVKSEYFLNQSMFHAQQNPHIAERIFILSWDQISRFEKGNRIISNDGWSTDYWNDYITIWIKNATLAVNTGKQQIEAGTALPGTSNIVQMSRIWRAYLWAEQVDFFGPAPVIDAYQGVNPDFNDVESIYKLAIKELSEASASIKIDQPLTDLQKKNDIMFEGDLESWRRYANSLGMRLAMRIKNADAPAAKAAFEAAAKAPGGYISAVAHTARVAEGGGWDHSTGVMTRTWNAQPISLSFSNLTIGLGDITLDDLKKLEGNAAFGLTDDLISTYSRKPNEYIGVEMVNHIPSTTNVANGGYFFDAIPYTIDPRTLVNFSIPGHDDKTVANYPNTDKALAEIIVNKGATDEEKAKKIKIRSDYTWGAFNSGEWSDKGTAFAGFTNFAHNVPTKSKVLRSNNNKRVFFGPWESHFLIAEAAHYGWDVSGVTVEKAYEDGIRTSFLYQGLTEELVTKYIASESYNRIGTSVKISHLTEATPIALKAKVLDGETIQDKADVTYTYPKGFYDTNNDVLTKIMTQKYISQCPWLPSEAWSDYRRLGLPFLENPMLEKALSSMPWYTDPSKAHLKNVIQRSKYPASLSTANKTGYDQGVAALGAGGDACDTFLWWAKKN